MDICKHCGEQIYTDDEIVTTSLDCFHIECAEGLGFQDDES